MLKRLSAFLDASAWVLILPAVLFLIFIDPPMVRTLAEWTAYALVLAGLAIFVSRVTFHQIDVEELLQDVKASGNRAAATVIASVVLFVGIVILSLVLWAKA